jgi:intraflagellar transport protein 140
MALYFDHELQKAAGRHGADISYTDVEWHQGRSIFSAASKNHVSDTDGAVHFYAEEGRLIENGFLQRSTTVQCMSWHTMKQSVAVGWKSGEITFYDQQDQVYHEQDSMHRAAIVSLLWNKSGRRLVSCDGDGLLAVWSADQRGFIKSAPSYHYRLQQPITHCVLHSTSSLVPDDFAAVFCAVQNGAVYYADSSLYRESYNVGTPILNMVFSPERHFLIIVTSSMDLCQVAVNQKGETTEMLKVKLGGKVKTSLLFRPELFVYSDGENLIRFWDFDRDENYALDLSSIVTSDGKPASVTCLHSDPNQGLLAAGTSSGHVILWQHQSPVGQGFSPRNGLDSSSNWHHISTTALQNPVLQVKWNMSKKFLAAVTATSVHWLSEELLVAHYSEQVSAVQTAPKKVKVECHNTGSVFTLSTDVHIRAVKCSKDHVAVWGDRKITVYNLVPTKETVRTIGMFECESNVFLLHDQSLFTLDGNHIQARTLQGTVKQVLSFIGEDGRPLVMDLSGHFIAAVSDTGVVKIWDVSRREPKQQSVVRLPPSVLQEMGEVSSIQCNCDGARVSLLSRKSGQPNSCLTIVIAEGGQVISYDFDSGHCRRTDEGEQVLVQPPQSCAKDQAKYREEIVGSYPIEHFWDTLEPRLLAVELKVSGQQYQSDRRKKALTELAAQFSGLKIEESRNKKMVATLFVTPDHGALLHEVVNMPKDGDRFLALSVPHLYFTKKITDTKDVGEMNKLGIETVGPRTVVTMGMRDFGGFKSGDQNTLKALLTFSYHATTGNMDEAFKSIKAVKSQKVWENMARMCVYTERADVAVICLSNMGTAVAGRAAREVQKIPEPQAKLAVIAAYLNMSSEAEALYRKSKRYDLLIQFYQAMGKWNKAIEVAELHDRLHLKTTHHLYGKYSEAVGEISAAISSYERAETYRTEVPRMLLDDPAQLEEYVMKSKDKAIRKWWGEYLESVGDLEAAMQFYEAARDYFAVVRVLCYMGNMKKV